MKETGAEMYNLNGVAYGELIRDYRKKKGLSQEQLGQVAHVKKNAVSAWEAGRSRPDVAMIPALCKTLDMPMYVFFGLGEKERSFLFLERFTKLNAYNQHLIMTRMEEMYRAQEAAARPGRKLIRRYRNDLSAAAGPVSYIGENQGELIYLADDPLTRLSDEILRVSGNSMEPTFYDGDQVLIQHTSRVREGEIGIFVNADAGYIKEYHPDGLYSHNPAYPVMRFHDEDSVRCVGRVLGVLHPEQVATEDEITAWREAGKDTGNVL